jgi:hypothetical protein
METDPHSNNSALIVEPSLTTGCVYLHNPFPECYCMGITSFKIFKMLKYCNGDFKLCEIYSNKIRGKNKRQAI